MRSCTISQASAAAASLGTAKPSGRCSWTILIGPCVRVLRFRKKSRKPPKKKVYSLFMASQKGFEPPTPRLGVAPISHREVTPDAKKCLEILGFSAFPIPSDTTL